MKNRKSTGNQKAGAPKPRKHVPKGPTMYDPLAYDYAMYLLNGRPQPRGPRPKKVKPPLWWLPASKK